MEVDERRAIRDPALLRAYADALPGWSEEDRRLAALFVKAGRGITPTEAGRAFADSCRTMLGLLQEARDGVREAERSRLRNTTLASVSRVILVLSFFNGP